MGTKKINPYVLTLFAFSDVILYGLDMPLIQFPVALLFYVFIICVFFSNHNLGIQYFISFNLLTIGIGNYWDNENEVISYWGLRLGPFSFNIIFTLILTLFVCIKRKWNKLIPKDPYSKFFLCFFIWGFLIGGAMALIGYNYMDNYKSDFMIFFPVILYIIICKDITLDEYNRIFRYVIPLTVYSLFLAFIFNRTATYAQESFVISNAVALLTPFGIIILRQYISKYQRWIYIAIYIILFCTLSVLLAGKLIIGFILLVLWWISLDKKWRYVNWMGVIIGIPLIVYLLEYLIELAANNSGITAFKLSQVLSLLDNPEFLALAGEYSSVGNIIAEGYTLFNYMIQHPFFLIFGKGFGGGIQDLYGFLTPFAGAAGYAEVDAVRNDFFNLHIAPYKIFIDGGLLIFIYYIKILYKILSVKTAISFLAFLMMIFYFYVSKEFMLLSYILLRMCYLTNKADKTTVVQYPSSSAKFIQNFSKV